MRLQTRRADWLAGSEGAGTKKSRAGGFLTNRVMWTAYVLSLILNDVFMATEAFRLAYLVRFESGLEIFQLDAVPLPTHYSTLMLLMVPIWLIIFIAIGLYKEANLLGGTQEYSMVARACTVGMMVLILAGFLRPQIIIARGWLILAWGFSFLFIASGRFLLRRLVYVLRIRGYFLSRTLIVGANDEGISLARQLMAWRTSGLEVIGYVDKKIRPGTLLPNGLRILGNTEELVEIVEAYGVEELVLASSAISSRDKMLEIFKRYGVDSRVNVRMSSGLYEIITTGLTVKEFAYVPLVGVNKVRLTGLDVITKRLLDYTLTMPGMLGIAPLLLGLAIAIKLDSPGPVLYRRRVMGVNGRQFDAFKFRTMYIDGDEILAHQPRLQAELARNHKLKDDPRVTRVGKFLRKFSLDELPQLINVLKGDMSLVGPRIICPEEIRNYDQWDINLLTVRPGLTGLWQVSGRSDISYGDRVRLDMHYIRNWSIWLDLQLLIRTIPAVIKAKGAY